MLADKQILQRCVDRVGTKRKLAEMLGVSPQTVSGWGSRHPIPRHVRPRLEEYLRAGQPARPTEQIRQPVIADTEIQERIRSLLRPETAADIEKLPRRYRERYWERVKEVEGRLKESLIEIVDNVERELTDFRARLVAEYRAQRRDRA